MFVQLHLHMYMIVNYTRKNNDTFIFVYTENRSFVTTAIIDILV